MNFLFFDLYRIERVWFGIIEYGATILFGVIEGWRPEGRTGCTALVLCMALLFLVFFIAIVVLRPYVSRFESICAFVIALIQLVGAVSIAVYAILREKPAINVGGWAATSGMYVLTFKAVSDLVISIYDIVLEQCREKKEKPAAGKDGEELEEITEPLLETPMVLSPLTGLPVKVPPPLPSFAKRKPVLSPLANGIPPPPPGPPPPPPPRSTQGRHSAAPPPPPPPPPRPSK